MYVAHCSGEALTVRSVDATLVVVPLRRSLTTSVARLTMAPLLLVDLRTQEGVTGHAYLYCHRESAGRAALALMRDVDAVLAGSGVSPMAIRRTLQSHFAFIGAAGLVSSVLAGVDVAAWDALALAAGLPLARLLGAPLRPVPVYNSNGLGLMDTQAAVDEARELVDEGFRAVKMRLGRDSARADLEAVRAVRRAIAPDIALMADFNQALGSAEARERCLGIDDEGLFWIEEPVRHDDYASSARLSATLRTPVQIGENFAGPRDMSLALSQHAGDFVMPDVANIGGVSGWRDAAALADIAGTDMSSHLFPEVSAHLLAATPTAHWLEYVDWAEPVLAEPLQVHDGLALPRDEPGNGLAWDPDAVAHYRVG